MTCSHGTCGKTRWLPLILAVGVIGAFAGISAINADSTAPTKAQIGAKAPDFTLTDVHGKTHNLSDFKDKIVVLEWINHGCPFVVKHYKSGNMQKLQETYTGKGVVWLAICSSAKGKQGYMTNEAWIKTNTENKTKVTGLLIDEDGTVGKLYGARTTPHMYIIDKEGTLVYAGAIDDNSSADASVIPDSKNFVVTVVDALLEGKPAPVSEHKPYGCSVKYAK